MARVFKRGKKWYIDYSYRGRRVIRSTKSRDKRMAELVLKDTELKIIKGEYLGVRDEQKILFRDYAEKYLAHSKANKTPKSHRRDITSITVNLLPVLGDHYLHELKSEMIENYKAMRLTRVKPATVNRELGCLRHMLNKAIEWGYLTNSPMRGIKLLKEPPGRVRYLEADEVIRLLTACSDNLRSIVLCALHTGMRKGEILNLKWEDIDFHNRSITVVKSKNNRRRAMPMSGILCRTLRKLHKKGEYVFTNRDGTRFADVKKGFCGALRRAKIKDFRFHDLRHTFASHLAMSGCNLRTIQELLGHADIKTTMRYAHLSRQHLEEAVNLVGARLWVDTNLEQSRIGSVGKRYAPVAQ